MLEFYTATKPKARKRHKCDLCGKTIEPGEKYSCFSGKYDGEMFTSKHCMPCNNIVNAYCDRYGNEYSEDEVADWLQQEYCDKCEHGGWADDDCEFITTECPHIRGHFTEKEVGGGADGIQKAQ